MNFKNILWTYRPKKDGTCAVKIYVNDNGKPKYIKTGLAVDPVHWDPKGKVKKSHPLHELYNAKIMAVRREVEDHFLNGGNYLDYKVKAQPGRASLMELCRTFLKEVEQGQLPIKAGTAKNYRATLRRLQAYCKLHNLETINFQDVDMVFYQDFTDYLGKYAGCKLPGISKHIKIIKRLMNMGLERKLHDCHGHQEKGFRRYKSRSSNKIYLTEEEIQTINSLDLSAQPSLEKERDRFLIGYFFILRFSDVIRISRDRIFRLHDVEYLRMKAMKTGIETIVPVKEEARAILEQYDYDLSFTSNQQANRALKNIAAMAGITQLATEGSRTLPKCQFVQTHTARRSAATNLYLQGVSTKIIADLGGWDNEQTLNVYLRASGLDTAILAKDLDFFK